MNEILLHPDEVKAVVERVSKETPSFTPPQQYLDIQREAICRAQVRKVVEWWTSPCVEHHIPKCVVGPVMDRMDCTVCLAALKAAGEGK